VFGRTKVTGLSNSSDTSSEPNFITLVVVTLNPAGGLPVTAAAATTVGGEILPFQPAFVITLVPSGIETEDPFTAALVMTIGSLATPDSNATAFSTVKA